MLLLLTQKPFRHSCEWVCLWECVYLSVWSYHYQYLCLSLSVFLSECVCMCVCACTFGTSLIPAPFPISQPQRKNWLVQFQDKVTDWEIWSGCWWMDFQRDGTIALPCVCAVTSWHLSWYNARCCEDVKRQQTSWFSLSTINKSVG